MLNSSQWSATKFVGVEVWTGSSHVRSSKPTALYVQWSELQLYHPHNTMHSCDESQSEKKTVSPIYTRVEFI